MRTKKLLLSQEENVNQNCHFIFKFIISNYLTKLFKVSTPAENLKLHKSFVQWMDDHSNFRTICEDGKGNLKVDIPVGFYYTPV